MMSNPFVAGIVDILGIVIYINVARLLLIALPISLQIQEVKRTDLAARLLMIVVT